MGVGTCPQCMCKCTAALLLGLARLLPTACISAQWQQPAMVVAVGRNLSSGCVQMCSSPTARGDGLLPVAHASALVAAASKAAGGGCQGAPEMWRCKGCWAPGQDAGG